MSYDPYFSDTVTTVVTPIPSFLTYDFCFTSHRPSLVTLFYPPTHYVPKLHLGLLFFSLHPHPVGKLHRIPYVQPSAFTYPFLSLTFVNCPLLECLDTPTTYDQFPGSTFSLPLRLKSLTP